MRILLVAAANSTTGGGEKHVADLMRGLSARGYTLGLIAPLGGDIQDIAQLYGVKYFGIDLGSGFTPKQVKAVRSVIEQFKPDIIHAHGSRAAVFARLADPLASKRVVYTIHGIHSDKGIAAPVKLWLERYLVPRTAAFISTCRADDVKGAELGIIEPSKSSIIYNGIADPVEVDKGLFRSEIGITSEDWLALHVGRLSPAKDHTLLVDAFSELNVDGAHLVMICPGEDAERSKLQSYIDAKPTKNQIHLLNGRPDLSTAFTDADVFVLSSLWEARPYVIVEAMSYGCPVISTDVGGINEAVEDGVTGILTPAKDAKSLTDALGKLRNHPELAHEMGAAGAQAIRDKFTLEYMLDQLTEVYEEVARTL